MDSNLTEFEKEYPSRPNLLKVLCILSFIGSTWAVVSNIWAYATAAQSAKMISYARNGIASDSLSRKDSIVYETGKRKREVFGEKIMVSFTKIFTEDSIRKNALGGILSAILTLLGAILMWRLYRIGFYVYVAGVIISIIVPFYLYGNNLLAVGISAFIGFFGLVFIALYALNFKSFQR
ncbi:MAG: hypothetical protein ABIO81_13155 [Ginsengibacter sp.]